MLRPRTLPAALLFASVALAGCGSDPIPLELLDFQASAQSVDAGQTVTLSWATSGASNVEIRQEPGGVVYTGADAAGTVESPELNLNTSFTLNISNAEGETATRMVSVEVIGINIVSFTASPATIGRGEATMLAWTLGGSSPSDVRLTDSQGQNVIQPGSNLSRQGSAMVQPDQTETYTLFAQAGGVMATQEVTVTVTSMPPTIDLFEARALIGGNVQVVTTVARNQQIQLFWELSNAEEVQISANGNIIRPWNTNGANPGGNVQSRATEERNEYLIEARNGPNPEDIATQTLVIVTAELPLVNSFMITPTEYTQGSTVATATWDTSNADGTFLQVNGQNVPNFTRATSGTFDFAVSGEANITLIARNAVGDSVQTQRIRFGYDDSEPNDTPPQAIPIPADGIPFRGTLTSTTDADVYAVMVPEGAGIFARIDDEMRTNCSGLDPTLTLSDASGTVLGSRNTAGLTRCAEILPPEFAGWAGNLTAGMYFLTVSRPAGTTAGRYAITARIIQLDPPLPNVTITAVGAPAWRVTDFVNVSVPWGTAANMYPERVTSIAAFLGTRHSAMGPNILTTFGIPNASSPSEFGIELRTMAAALGYQSKTSFSAGEWSDPNGLLFGYTLVPSATATTGTSRDFPTAPGGPVILNGIFPISIAATVSIDGMDIGELPGGPQVTGDATADGLSHMNVLHALGAGAFTTPPALPAGVAWAIQLRDNTNAGYDVGFTFNVAGN